LTDTSPVAAKPQTLVWSNPWHNLAFGFGSGLMPKAPGTWGSLVALPFVPLWQLLPGWGYLLMLGLTMLFGVWLCGKVARELGVQFVFRNRSDGLIGQWVQGGLRRRFSGPLKGPRRIRV